jgi:hypothetical protein
VISAPLAKLERFGDAGIRQSTDPEPSFEEAGDSVILTSKGSQTSAAFLPHAIPVGQSFKATAKILLRGTADCGFADGVAIVLTADKGLGAHGGGAGLGFSGLGGIGDVAVAGTCRMWLSAALSHDGRMKLTAVKTWRAAGTEGLGESADPPAPCITLQSPLSASHDKCLAFTPPGSTPWLSRVYTAPFAPNGPLHTRYPFRFELFYNANKDSVTGTLLYRDPEKNDTRERRLFLFEEKIPKSEAAERFVGVTASTGACQQAVSVPSVCAHCVQPESSR